MSKVGHSDLFLIHDTP